LHTNFEGGPSVLALDIGGTTIKGAVFNRSGQQTDTRSYQTFRGDRSAYDSAVSLLASLLSEALALGQQPQAIGVGTPGLIDPTSGTVRFAANLSWRELPLKTRLEERFGLPVAVDHDARTAARAELDARPHVRDLLFIPVGTGLSAAIAVNGRLVTGATGATGEFGHMTVLPGGEACGCGQNGCVEAYASAGSILRRYTNMSRRSVASAADVIALAATDSLAREVWEDAVNALAGGISALTAILDPSDVVIGGGLARAGELLLDPLQRAVSERLSWRPPPAISLSKLGQRAGLVGAAVLARDLTGMTRRSEVLQNIESSTAH
jgi:glucokinase